MTYKNKVIALSSAFAALLLVYAASLIFSPERSLARAETGKIFSGKEADVAEVDLDGIPQGSVPIQQGGGQNAEKISMLFKKSGSDWSLEEDGASLPALPARISSLVSAVAKVKSLSPRSGSESSWASFGLAGGSARHVVLKDKAGKVLADFYAGSYSATGSEIYLRLAGKPEVYAADAELGSYLESSRASWLNRALFKNEIKTDDVQSIEFSSTLNLSALTAQNAAAVKAPAPVAYTATRSGSSWTVKGAAVDPQSVAGIVRSGLSLEGDDMFAAAPPEAFEKIPIGIVFHMGDGQSLKLEIGSRAGSSGLYWARSSASPFVFQVSIYGIAGLLR